MIYKKIIKFNYKIKMIYRDGEISLKLKFKTSKTRKFQKIKEKKLSKIDADRIQL